MAATAMATAASASASASASLHCITALPTLPRTVLMTATVSLQNPTNLQETLTKPLLLQIKSPPRHLCRPLYSSAPSIEAAFIESDEDYIDEEEEGEEEEEEEEVVEEEEEDEPVQRSRAVTSPPGEPGRLYVGNLPYSMTPQQLLEIFSQAGTVKSAEIVYDRVTDRSRGFAFITMASTEDASKAIRMFDGSQVGGRTVKVNFPEVPRGGEREVMGPRTRSTSRGYVESPHKVYAGNLGWTVTSESLKDAFITQPGILGAKVIYERDSGRSRGYGFVSFSSAEDAQAAIEAMNGAEVEGRPLRLNLASERFSYAPTQDDNAEEPASSPVESGFV